MDMSATTAVISVLGACLAGLLGYYLQGLRADIRRIDRRLDRYEIAHQQAMERLDTIHRQDAERIDTAHRQEMAANRQLMERIDTAHRHDAERLDTTHRQEIERIDTAHRQEMAAHRQTMERLGEAQGDMMAMLASQTATLAAQYQQMERMMGHGERISTLEGALSAAS